MLCSNCGESLKPVVAVDIDGTLGNWHQLWFNFAEGYFGRKFDRHYTGKKTLAAHMGLSKRDYREAKLVFRQGAYKRTMVPYPGAPQFVQGLVESGFEVWITTTRPYLRHDNIDPDTREWLRRNDIPFDGLLYDEDKYGRLVELVHKDRIVAVLDDEVENCNRATELGLRSVLMVNEFNSESAPSMEQGCAYEFKQVFKALAWMLDEWRRNYGQE